MANVTFSFCVFFCCFEELIFFCFSNNEFEKDIFVIQQKFLEGGLVLFGLLKDRLNDSVEFIVQNIIVFKGLDEFYEDGEKVRDVGYYCMNVKLFQKLAWHLGLLRILF